jgi:hypothetical protein
MPKMIIRTQHFYNACKKAGLKRGEFTAYTPKDSYGEYGQTVTRFVIAPTLEQCQIIADCGYRVVYSTRKDGTLFTYPMVWPADNTPYNRKGVYIYDYNNVDDFNLPTITKI